MMVKEEVQETRKKGDEGGGAGGGVWLGEEEPTAESSKDSYLVVTRRDLIHLEGGSLLVAYENYLIWGKPSDRRPTCRIPLLLTPYEEGRNF